MFSKISSRKSFGGSLKKITLFIVALGLVSSSLIQATPSLGAAPSGQSEICSVDYVVKDGDLIGLLAEKYYGQISDYIVIFNATNVAAKENDKYSKLPNPNLIEPGQTLCIPDAENAQQFRGPIVEEESAPIQNTAVVQAPAKVAAAQTIGGDNSIRFSHEATLVHNAFLLTLTSQKGGGIRYTSNGARPDENSTPYTGPIAVNQSMVIRAQVFKADGSPLGEVYTKSYILTNYDQSIPVISIVTDWAHLDSIHSNPKGRGREWERPINMEYFAPGGAIQFNVKAGIRLHGNFSRLFNPKKSYRLYFRKSYGGPGKLNYPLFEDAEVTKFDKLVLKAGFQDSFTFRGIADHADRHHTAKYISDQVARNLHRDMGQPTAHGDWVLLYLNGEFWGLYNLTERIDTEFLQSYSAKDSQWDVITKESGWDDMGHWYSREAASEGNYGGWLDNQNWVGGADFTNPGNIGGLEWRVDMENVFSYMFLQAYIQNADWPSANWVAYQRVDPEGKGNERKWRMMVWDAEDSFGNGADGKIDLNTIARVHSPHDSITRILEKPFISNCGYKHLFVNRAREYLGVENQYGKPESEVGQLSKERVKAEIMKQAAIVRPFMQLETDRWAPDLPGVALFEKNIEHALTFAEEREEIILHHLDILRYQTFTECK